MKRIIIGMLGLLLLFSPGCGERTSDLKITTKVKVTQAGAITFNGKAVSLEELKAELNRLKQVEGTIEYFREGASGEPSEKALEVFGVIMESGLPIKLSTKE